MSVIVDEVDVGLVPATGLPPRCPVLQRPGVHRGGSGKATSKRKVLEPLAVVVAPLVVRPGADVRRVGLPRPQPTATLALKSPSTAPIVVYTFIPFACVI